MDVMVVLFKLFMIVLVAAIVGGTLHQTFESKDFTPAHNSGVEYAAMGAALAILVSGRHLFTGLAFDNNDEFNAQTILTLVLFAGIGYVAGRIAHKD